MKILVLALLIFLAGCATPVGQLSQQTLDARVAVHAAAMAQALETKREAEEWVRAFGTVQTAPLPAAPAIQVAPIPQAGTVASPLPVASTAGLPVGTVVKVAAPTAQAGAPNP
jgi:hypothetical protein